MTRSALPFDKNVERWLRYSESPEGRLRQELTWYNLQDHLTSLKGWLKVLDAGCGLGEMAALMADRAEELVLLDFSEKMIAEAKRLLSMREGGPARGKRMFVHGRAEDLQSLCPNTCFDLVLCHTLLEYVESPRATVGVLAERLGPQGILSLVAVNRFSEALRLALRGGDLQQARRALGEREFTAPLFDHTVKRTFSLEELQGVVAGLGLRIRKCYGIRVLADYVPDAAKKPPDYERLLLDLEKEASRILPLIHMARYLHLVCEKEA